VVCRRIATGAGGSDGGGRVRWCVVP